MVPLIWEPCTLVDRRGEANFQAFILIVTAFYFPTDCLVVFSSLEENSFAWVLLANRSSGCSTGSNECFSFWRAWLRTFHPHLWLWRPSTTTSGCLTLHDFDESQPPQALGSPGDLPNLGSNSDLRQRAGTFLSEPSGKPLVWVGGGYFLLHLCFQVEVIVLAHGCATTLQGREKPVL